MYCSNCGQYLQEGTLYCPNCGHPVAYGKIPEKNQENLQKTGNFRKKRRKKGPWIFLIVFLVLIVTGGSIGTALYCSGKDNENPEVSQETFQAYYQPVAEEKIRYEDGELYVDSHLLVTANETASFKKVQSLAEDMDGVIVGYISLSNDYQIEFPNGKTLDELQLMIENLKENPAIDNVQLEHVYSLNTHSIDYTTDPWLSAYTPDNTGEEWTGVPDGANWWAEAIHMPEVWEGNYSFADVKVGLLDTFFDPENEDLDGKFAEDGIMGQDNINVTSLYNETLEKEKNNQEVTFSSSDIAHGTVDAGIIGAKNNTFGICGISQNAVLYGVSLFGNSQSRSSSLMTYKYGIAWLLNQGVKIINISMGDDLLLFSAQQEDQEDDRTDAALRDLEVINDDLCVFLNKCLESYDFLIVKAAGNNSGIPFVQTDVSKEFPYGYRKALSSDPEDSHIYMKCDAKYGIFSGITDPKVEEHIIVVGALDLQADSLWAENPRTHEMEKTLFPGKVVRMTIAYFSNIGEQVDIYAPGDRIWVDEKSTQYGIMSDFPNNITDYMEGTSQAAPMISGTAALVWGLNPQLTAREVKDIICSSADKGSDGFLSEENKINEPYKVLNVFKAVEMASAAQSTGQMDDAEKSAILGYVFEETQDASGKMQETRLQAEIKIYNQDKSALIETPQLDNNDEFTVILDPGDYTITVTCEGYEDYEAQLHLNGQETLFYTVKLSKIDAYERDRNIYNQYLTNGGYEKLIGDTENLFSTPENLGISSVMYDVNGDGTYELLLEIIDTSTSGPVGQARLTFLLGIENENVKEYQQAYFTGGTMLGSSIYFLYDTETQKPVVIVNNAFKNGIFCYHSEMKVFSDDLLEPEVTWEESSFARVNGEFIDYEDVINEIRQETDLYFDDGIVFSCYKVNEQYVTEDELGQVAGRFASDDSIPEFLPGTYDEPVAEMVSSGSDGVASDSDFSNSSSETVQSQIEDADVEGQILRKNVEGSLNIRSLPQHDSDLVGTVDSSSEQLIYNGETSEGLGSDGQMHNWHYITTSSGMAGWVRGDLIMPDSGSLKMSDQSLRYYRKGVEGTLNIRSLPQHDSDLVGIVPSQDEPLAFYGEIGVGYGSDGIMHEWYKITTGSGITGWVRSDFVWAEVG